MSRDEDERGKRERRKNRRGSERMNAEAERIGTRTRAKEEHDLESYLDFVR